MRGDLGPQLGSLFGDRASNGAPFGLTLVIYYHTSIVLAVDVRPIRSSPRPSLSDDDSRVEFLPDLVVTFLAGAHDNIADGASGEPVETASHGHDGNDEEILGSGVVGAVHGGCDGQPASDSQLDTDGTCL